jgi:hypothetical protein
MNSTDAESMAIDGLSLVEVLEAVLIDRDGLHAGSRTVMRWSDDVSESERARIVSLWSNGTERMESFVYWAEVAGVVHGRPPELQRDEHGPFEFRGANIRNFPRKVSDVPRLTNQPGGAA